ncbi:hypothetical protein J437_LFUL013632 [Ladona fulva]|uniref:Uncharacterized protein n=1 Tax=Ladona fulva TaxID=123851 RepID=A0A8K0P6I1_LADFU|nr:hypothetical protein J437_LFUL013632 [Ladona fulva]
MSFEFTVFNRMRSRSELTEWDRRRLVVSLSWCLGPKGAPDGGLIASPSQSSVYKQIPLEYVQQLILLNPASKELDKRTRRGPICCVDSLPLSRSTNNQLWPILVSFDEVNEIKPFAVGIYHGNCKPNSAEEYLGDFKAELLEVLNLGIQHNGKNYQVYISWFILDTPAYSFVMQTVSHTAYYNCWRCVCKGKYEDSNGHSLTTLDTFCAFTGLTFFDDICKRSGFNTISRLAIHSRPLPMFTTLPSSPLGTASLSASLLTPSALLPPSPSAPPPVPPPNFRPPPSFFPPSPVEEIFLPSSPLLIFVVTSVPSSTPSKEGREEDSTETEVIIEEDGDTINTAGQKKKPPAEEEELFKCALKAFQRQQDDCDILRECVASELRNLKLEFNNRRLKSKIRKAAAGIADEDDYCFASTSSFSPSLEYSLSPIILVLAVDSFLTHRHGVFKRDSCHGRRSS